ncbi:MAG: carbohydrate kinase [Sphaerochaetaceae bacterium]|nr:carbohydrate kinase [Sphaerochaetaceae bacterium]
MKHVIGIDVGTSLIKAALYDDEGTTLLHASSKVKVMYPQEGYAEQNMNDVWEGVVSCVRKITDRCDDVESIAAVSCAGQGDGLWSIDSQGQPVGNAVLWSDNRASKIVEEWMHTGVSHQFFTTSGNTLWPGCTAPILRWLSNHDPDQYQRIDTIFYCKDWINYNLTGITATDYTDGTIPFMDPVTGEFSTDQIRLLGFEDDLLEKLPPLKSSFDVLGTVTNAAAKVTGLPEGLPVVTGMIDVMANAIAAGAVLPGQSFSIIGTTLLNAILMDRPVSEPADVGFMLTSPLEHQWVRVLGSLSGTPNLDWFLRELYDSLHCVDMGAMYRQIQGEVESVPVGANGVSFLPFIHGERSPFVNAHATSSFLGIREKTTRADMLRAVYESIGFATKHNLSSVDAQVQEMLVTGGGSNDDVWCQLIADITGAKIRVPDQKELGTLGAAIAAARGVGVLDALAFVSSEKRKERIYTPDGLNHARYEKLYELYLLAVDRMMPYWDKRNEIYR